MANPADIELDENHNGEWAFGDIATYVLNCINLEATTNHTSECRQHTIGWNEEALRCLDHLANGLRFMTKRSMNSKASRTPRSSTRMAIPLVRYQSFEGLSEQSHLPHVDWIHEEAVERLRKHDLASHRGLRGLLLPLWDASRVWLVLIGPHETCQPCIIGIDVFTGTGLGVGVIGGWLDVLVKW